MKTFLSLLKREFRMIFSNQVVMAIFFAAPIFYGVLFGFIYEKGQADDLPVMVVDLDNSPMSAKVLDAINDNTALEISDLRYSVANVDKDFKQDKYCALVTIPDGFEANLLMKRSPEINVDINTTNILTANYSAKALQVVFGVINAGIEIEALKKKGNTPQFAMDDFQPFSVNYTRFYNESGNYMTFLWPGMVGTIIQQVFLLAVALAFAREFEKRTIIHILKHKYSALQMIGLKALPFIILGTLVWLVVAIMFPIFKIPFSGTFIDTFIPSVLFTLSLIFLGIMVSIVVPNQLKATEILMIIAAPSFVLSGYTWPLYLMPKAISAVASVIPLTHYLEIFRRVAFMGGTMSDATFHISSLIVITIVCFILSWIFLTAKLKLVKRSRKK